MKIQKINAKEKNSKTSKFGWKHCFMIGVSIFILYLCIVYWRVAAAFIGGIIGAASPLFIGAAIAYILNILMAFYERTVFKKAQKKLWKKTKRPISLCFAFITMLAIIALVVGLVLPQFIECCKLIIQAIPDVAQSIIGFLEKHHILTDKTLEYLKSFDWQSWVGRAVSVLSSGLGNVMDVVISTVSSVFSGIVTAVLSLIFAVYILISKEKLYGQVSRLFKNYTKPKFYNRVKYTVGILDACFHNYIVGQCIEAVILGSLCAVGMLILRLPYAPMIGALIALTALIPVAGAYIGAGVGAFLILMESPLKALIFLIFIIVLQQIEGNLIYPKVVGSSIGLPGIWVLAAVTIGGGVMGVVGMLLGVPLAAALYKMLRNDLKKREKEADKGVVLDAEVEKISSAD